MKIRMLVLLLMCNVVSAGIIHVPQDFPNIQIAIQEAVHGDIIILSPGIYFEAINFSGKRIIIQSEDPLNPEVVDATIIDAMGLGSVVSFLGSENENSKLFGVTVQGGNIGVFGDGALSIVENCNIRNNVTGVSNVNGQVIGCSIHDNSGIGYSSTASPAGLIIENCVISDNQTGVRLFKGTVKNSYITDNANTGIVSGNSSSFVVADSVISNNLIGISVFHLSIIHIKRCIITGNRSHGIQGASTTSGIVENSIVSGNKGSGFFFLGSTSILSCSVSQNAIGFQICTGTIRHCIIWNNTTALDRSSTPELSGTIDPFFVQPGGWSTALNRWIEGDYHLIAESPYIDSGDPFYGDDPNDPIFDADGRVRVIGARIDIGAYEFDQDCVGADFDNDGTPDLCDKDIDGDGITNKFDQCNFTPPTFLIDEFGRPRADLNRDCLVNLADFAILQRDF